MESDEECIFGLTEIKTWSLKITVQKKKKKIAGFVIVSLSSDDCIIEQAEKLWSRIFTKYHKNTKKVFANKILLIIHYLLDPCKDWNNFYTACHIKIEIRVQTQPETDTIAQKDANQIKST